MSDVIATAAEAYEADVLPRRVDLHTEDQPDGPLPQVLTDRPFEEKSEAEWAYERLILYIQEFEETLDAEQEVAVGFVGSDAGILSIEGMGFFEPDIITFYGTDENGARMQLVQHVSQLSVVLRALPKSPIREEARRIGFQLASGLERA